MEQSNMTALMETAANILDRKVEEIEPHQKALLPTLYHHLKKELNTRRTKQFEGAMTLKELFWQTKFDDVFDVLTTDFDYEEEEYADVKKAYNNIIKSPKKEEQFGLKVEEDGDVSGISFEKTYDMGITFLHFDQLANSYVEQQSLAAVGNVFFVASMLDELMWMPDDEGKDELKEEVETTQGVTLKELLANETADTGNVVPIRSEVNPVKEAFREFLQLDEHMFTTRTIRSLFDEQSEEVMQETFEEVLACLEHPLVEIDWQGIFKHAYNSLKYAPIQVSTEAIYFAHQYDFLTQFRNPDDKSIKCVLFGEHVLNYLDCPTHAVVGNLFPDEEKPAYALLAYIGDTYTTNPARFAEDEEIARDEKMIKESRAKRKVLLQHYFEQHDMLESLSMEDFEELYACFQTIEDIH